MNQIREIVTKAVVAKGKKTIRIKKTITADEEVYSILGCMAINNRFKAKKENTTAFIDGNFELNIWYSTEGNAKTNILKDIVKYQEEIKTKQIINDYIAEDDDIIIKALAHPTCKDVELNNNQITVEIEFELVVDVIGEAKMQVNILENMELFMDDEDDFTNEINENFIREK